MAETLIFTTMFKSTFSVDAENDQKPRISAIFRCAGVFPSTLLAARQHPYRWVTN
jgi:hypothetical protein